MLRFGCPILVVFACCLQSALGFARCLGEGESKNFFCYELGLKLQGSYSSLDNKAVTAAKGASSAHLFLKEGASFHGSARVSKTFGAEAPLTEEEYLYFQVGSIDREGVATGFGLLPIPFGFSSPQIADFIPISVLNRLTKRNGQGATLVYSNQENRMLELAFLQTQEDFRFREGRVVESNTLTIRHIRDTGLLYQTKIGFSLYASSNEARGIALSLKNYSENGKLTLLEFKRTHYLSGRTRFQQSFAVDIQEEWKKSERLRYLYYDQRNGLRQLTLWKDYLIWSKSVVGSFGLRYQKNEEPDDTRHFFSALASLEYKS